ncbi:hypothetical protein RM553_18180 [Zunongwangia sp. F363]|uniref:Ribosomal protein L27 n=1 Tax=Autumnicola tepida TaxID=3075595 RepID=A0ABU3CEL1_9FLAO|nr:hypothetical protein [Zunongwangia sp. F363]MDT0644775.1 hypothetical protein [Zunongwangia sp. F363]
MKGKRRYKNGQMLNRNGRLRGTEVYVTVAPVFAEVTFSKRSSVEIVEPVSTL